MPNQPLVRLVDDDTDFRRSQELFLGMSGFDVRGFGSARELLEEDDFRRPGCLVLDIRMPVMTGLELQQALVDRGVTRDLPVIFLTGHGDLQAAVHTFKNGAFDFIEKKGDPLRLKEVVEKACVFSVAAYERADVVRRKRAAFDALTEREKDVLVPAARGKTNKEIAAALGIGVETVKMHRANAFGKLGLQGALEAYRWLEGLDGPGVDERKEAAE